MNEAGAKVESHMQVHIQGGVRKGPAITLAAHKLLNEAFRPLNGAHPKGNEDISPIHDI